MHPSDGNTYAINARLAGRETYDAANQEPMYCGACDETISAQDWPECIDTETCPNCGGSLCEGEADDFKAKVQELLFNNSTSSGSCREKLAQKITDLHQSKL